VRITALAILGSDTSTSLMSPGRSTTTDLPTPSGTKFEPNSEATTFTGGGGATGGACFPAHARPTPAIAAKQQESTAARKIVLFLMANGLISVSWSSSRRTGRC
jgi:hypothetical protein